MDDYHVFTSWLDLYVLRCTGIAKLWVALLVGCTHVLTMARHAQDREPGRSAHQCDFDAHGGFRPSK